MPITAFSARPNNQLAFNAWAADVEDALEPIQSVKTYGAVGDGVTDDTEAIQACADALDLVYLPSGIYKTTSPIVLDANTKITGDGKLASAIVAAHSGRILSWEDVSTYSVHIDDICIQGNGSSIGIYVASSVEETAHIKFSNLRIVSCDIGVEGIDTYSVFDSVYDQVDFILCTTYGTKLGGSQETFIGCTWRSCGWGLKVDNQVGDVSIGGGAFIGCTWVANTYDLVIATPTVRPLSFVGCWMEQAATLSVGTTEVGEVNFLALSFVNCLFQPAATATLGGVMSNFSYKGTISFNTCVLYKDLYSSAAFPSEADEDGNSYVTRAGCIVIDGSAVVTKQVDTYVRATSSTFANLPAGTTAKSSLRFVQGAAPTSPVDGDMWREDNTNTGLKIRINGVTKTITVS